MIDSYDKLLSLEYGVVFLTDYLIVVMLHTLTKRFSDKLIIWILINVIGLICVANVSLITPNSFAIIYAGGITRFGLLTVSLLIFSTRFIARYLRRWEGQLTGKLRIAAIGFLPFLVALSLGYGLIQMETDKISAQRDLDDYQARLRLFRMMRNDPDMQLVMAAFKANFPLEADQVFEKFTWNTMRRREALKGGVEYRPGEALNMVSQFLSSQSANISRSSDEHLVTLFAAEKAFFQRLRRFPALCALVAEGEKESLNRLDDPILKQAAGADELSSMGRLLSAALASAGDGHRHPKMRDFTKLPPRLVSTISALPMKQRQLLAGELAGNASDTCTAQIDISEAVSHLPRHDIAFWTAYLYAQRNTARTGLAPNT